MKLSNEIVKWFNTNHNLAYSLISIFLGVALFARSLILLSNLAAISELAGQNNLYWWYSYINIIHLIGGLLLTLGLLIRIAVFLQIPILVGAVFFIQMWQGLMTEEQSLLLVVLVLVILIVYSFFVSISLSLDNYFYKRKSALQSVAISKVSV
ncbi:MAG: hypothetical protein IH950_16845 [Bacteroidetes bacterium]|nr:hypothetical protein [Bacteroidota bacterium]